jgi:3-phenylpropionate/cinnamic acid dioxygenase small subunit
VNPLPTDLKSEVEAFYYDEAELLDDRRYNEWLDMLADDLVYFMPIRRNVKFGEHARLENTRQGEDVSWFDEDKWTLTKRVEQLLTGVHWAEEPFSRVSHLITNIQIIGASPNANEPQEVDAKSRFLIYKNRVESETSLFVGKRRDTLCKRDGRWQLKRREIILDQSVLQAKNLTVFF